jgi:hypothetical protein
MSIASAQVSLGAAGRAAASAFWFGVLVSAVAVCSFLVFLQNFPALDMGRLQLHRPELGQLADSSLGTCSPTSSNSRPTITEQAKQRLTAGNSSLLNLLSQFGRGFLDRAEDLCFRLALFSCE